MKKAESLRRHTFFKNQQSCVHRGRTPVEYHRISSMHAFCEWVCNIILENMWKRKKLKVMDSAECFSDLWKTRWHGNCRVEGPTPPHDQRTSRLHGRRSSCLHLSRCGYKWSSKIHFVLGRSRSCLKCLADAAWMFFLTTGVIYLRIGSIPKFHDFDVSSLNMNEFTLLRLRIAIWGLSD